MAASASANAGTWASLQPRLRENTLDIISSLGFVQMTPVQAAAIPQFMTNKDVAVEAITGSGKTLAFVVPTVEILARRETKLRRHDVGAVILLPTRELANQVKDVLMPFLAVADLSLLLAIGGTDAHADVSNFKKNGGNIVLATPGRMDDLMRRLGSDMHLKELEVLVLDEADRLLDMGFENSITSILSRLPKQRRTGLFSATQTQEVEKLVRAGLRNPVRIAVKVQARDAITKQTKSQATPTSLKNYFLITEYDTKFPVLVDFLTRHKDSKMIIYFSTCACVEYYTRALQVVLPKDVQQLLPVLSLHGKMVHKRRTLTFEKFKSLSSGILICTDVAARGLDMPDVDWVIQFDPPTDPSSFVHRCGRTARQGREGSAVVFLSPKEDSYVEFLRMRNVPLQEMSLEGNMDNAKDLLTKVRTAASKDRELYEKGCSAFVSFVRAYKEHKCHLIFRFKDLLPMDVLARGFALVHLPRMPELKGVDVPFEALSVEPSSIPYLDKAREKQRLIRLEKDKAATAEKKAAAEKERKLGLEKNKGAWSYQKDKKDRREKRRETKSRKRAYNERMAGNGSGMDEEDLAELDNDTKLLKKLKKGKMSKEAVDEQIGTLSSDGD